MSWAEEQDWFGLEDLALEAQQRADEAKELIKQGIWLTASHQPTPLHSMTDRHIENCIRMIEDGRLNRKWALPYLRAEQAKRAKVSKS